MAHVLPRVKCPINAYWSGDVTKVELGVPPGAATGFQPGGRGDEIFRNKTFSGIRNTP